MSAHRNPIFGVLAVVAPLFGYYFQWRISSDKVMAEGDYTGLAVPLALFIWYAPCLLLCTLFGIVSLVRNETPKQIAWAGLGLGWLPVAVGYIRTHVF